jgi:hypothetical protein
MTDAVAIQPIRLPTVSYGPFRLMEAVPWLMLAAAMRVLTVKGGLVWLFASIFSDIAIFLAFMLAARRMIELTDGKTALGRLSFAQQLIIARTVLVPVILMILVVSITVVCMGAHWTGFNLLFGFDGIAFDQKTPVGMVWSAFLAAVCLLLLLKAENTGKAKLFDALRELWQRSVCMVPAIITVSFADIGLSVVQGIVRTVVYAFWHNSTAPSFIRALVFFFFVFAFASIRLWTTLAILVFALRESYRRGARAT